MARGYEFVVQGLWSDGRIESEWRVPSKAKAIREARVYAKMMHFEGSSVRVISQDGEFVFEVRRGQHRGTRQYPAHGNARARVHKTVYREHAVQHYAGFAYQTYRVDQKYGFKLVGAPVKSGAIYNSRADAVHEVRHTIMRYIRRTGASPTSGDRSRGTRRYAGRSRITHTRTR